VVNGSKLWIFAMAGIPAVFAACGGDNLTLPSEGEPAHIEILAGNGQQAPVNSELPTELLVRVTDTQNRPVPAATVEFVLDEDGAGGSVSPATDTTDSKGEARASITLGTRVGAVTGRAQVPVDEGTTPVTTAFTATALSADANIISAISGEGQSGPVGTTLAQPLVVQVTDGFGNPISGITIQWTAQNGGSVSEPSNVTDGNGQASVTRTLGSNAGDQSTLASADGLAGSVTFAHTATAGNAARVIIVSGDGQQGAPGAQLPNQLVVEVLDAQNNPIPGRAVAWVVGAGDGTANPETSNTDAQGRASTQWTLGAQPGRNTLSAVVSGVGVAPFTATGTRASSSTNIVSHLPEPSIVGQPVEVRVEVAGSGATPTGSVSVSAEGGGSCEITLSNGSGACSLTIGTAGNQRITATYNGDGRFNASSDNENHRVEAENTPPTAAFTPPSCTATQPCPFNDGSSDSDGNVVAWTWEFGDGAGASEPNPSHTYAAAGTYNVRLTVRDDDGATSEVTHQVNVSAPQVNFPPVATDDGYTTSPGTSFHAPSEGRNSLLANDADLDGDQLSTTPVASAATPLGGSVTIGSDGSFDYTAPATPGTDSFSYTVTDGRGGSDTGNVTITVQ
jgi:PKD repeat protein